MSQVVNTKRFPDNSILGMRIWYIAMLNPKGVNTLAYRHGYHPPRKDNLEDRIKFINSFISEEGEDAMTELLAIHPDKNMILDNVIDEVASDKNIHSDWIDTVVAKSGKNYSNYEGEPVIKTIVEQSPIIETPKKKIISQQLAVKKENKDIPYIGITIIIALTVVAIAIINKKM